MGSILFSFILIFNILLGVGILHAEEAGNILSEAEALRRMIDAKNAELQAIQAEREKVEKNIEETVTQKNSLSKEIKIIDSNINQLNLSIKANRLVLDTLGLEIESLAQDIGSIESEVDGKKATISKLFVELQQRDRENLLVLMLRNKSLAEGMAEAESIISVNNDLEASIAELRNLQVDLGSRLIDEKNKKRVREIEKVNLTSRQGIVQDQKQEKQRVLTQTKNQEQLYQKELEELVKRQLAISEEVEKIETDLRTKIDPGLLPIARPGVLALPVAGARLSQEYGHTAFARNGYKGKFHNGVDFAAPVGTPIFAAESGTVYYVGDQDRYCPKGAYGRFIVINHDNNLTTLYAHLSKMVVTKGTLVERGDLIGYIGRTGYATGAHLHFTVYAASTFYMGTSRTCGPMPFGGDMDPDKYLNI